MEILPLVYTLICAGSAVRKVYRKWNDPSAESKRNGGDTNVEIEINLDPGDRSESPDGEDAIIAIAADLAMKAKSSWLGSRARRNRAITGLSTKFAEHRSQVREGTGMMISLDFECTAV